MFIVKATTCRDDQEIVVTDGGSVGSRLVKVIEARWKYIELEPRLLLLL